MARRAGVSQSTVSLVLSGKSAGRISARTEAAVRAANNAIQVHGGAGYVDDYPVAKYLRDARVMTLYEGTSQIQKLLIGRAETGISAFG